MRVREPFEWRGARIECLRTDLPWDDSALLVTDGGATVFDMNDCKLEDATLDALGRDTRIDAALVPYSGAIQFPTCYELDAATKLELCEKRRAGHLRFFADRVSRLRARFGVPFAAGYCLPSVEQWWMNDVNNITSPAQAKASLEASAPTAYDGRRAVCLDMNPGDTWDSAEAAGPSHGLTRHAPAPDWSRHFELVREHARAIEPEVRRARASEEDPEPGLDERFVARFTALLREQEKLAREAKYRVQFDARGAQGFLGYVDTASDPPRAGLGALDKPNLTIRIPTSMLDAVLAGRVTWDEVLISFRLWFHESPPGFHEPWWALLHSSNRLDPERYLTRGGVA
jgi:UDP-MurNAc hydroxylase